MRSELTLLCRGRSSTQDHSYDYEGTASRRGVLRLLSLEGASGSVEKWIERVTRPMNKTEAMRTMLELPEAGKTIGKDF